MRAHGKENRKEYHQQARNPLNSASSKLRHNDFIGQCKSRKIGHN